MAKAGRGYPLPNFAAIFRAKSLRLQVAGTRHGQQNPPQAAKGIGDLRGTLDRVARMSSVAVFSWQVAAGTHAVRRKKRFRDFCGDNNAAPHAGPGWKGTKDLTPASLAFVELLARTISVIGKTNAKTTLQKKSFRKISRGFFSDWPPVAGRKVTKI